MPGERVAGRVLVVAATRAEARYVPDGVPLLITEMGKVAAATAVTAWLASSDRPHGLQVWNIGTAGALRGGVTGLLFPGRVINHDLSAELLRGMGVTVEDSLPIAGGDDAVVLATGDSFIADAAARDALAQELATL